MSDETVIYDPAGMARLRIVRGGDIFDFSGTPRGFVQAGSVYLYDGSHVGRYDRGLLRDSAGRAVGFSQGATGGPLPPIPQIPPIPAINQIPPIRGIPAIPPVPPVPQLSWSDIDIDLLLPVES